MCTSFLTSIKLENLGRITEQGTPEELKTSGGIYQKIYEIQLGIDGNGTSIETDKGEEVRHD